MLYLVDTWNNIQETEQNCKGRVKDWNWLLEDRLSQVASHHFVRNNLTTGVLDENCPVRQLKKKNSQSPECCLNKHKFTDREIHTCFSMAFLLPRLSWTWMPLLTARWDLEPLLSLSRGTALRPGFIFINLELSLQHSQGRYYSPAFPNRSYVLVYKISAIWKETSLTEGWSWRNCCSI